MTDAAKPAAQRDLILPVKGIYFDQITAEEGASVTFTGPNPDFNDLPNEVVSVCNHATGWVPEYFRADTLADCLRAALAQSVEGGEKA